MDSTASSDPLSEAIGSFGKWHWTLFIILIIPIKMSALWPVMAIIFLAPKTDFVCVERTNATEIIVNSTCYKDCVAYKYSSEFDNTIISEWDLICDKGWLANFNQTVLMLGVLVGSFIFGGLADRCGRRVALLSACMLQLITSVAAAFAPSFWVFTAIRFFIGIATAGLLIVSYTLMVEVTGPAKREMLCCITQMPLTVAQMLLPAFAFYLRSWNTFSLGLAVPNLVFLVYFFLAPESPKWLITTGQLEKASRVMTKAAKINGLPARDMVETAKDIAAAASSEVPKVKATFLDLILRRSVRMNNFLSCLSWLILGLAFYGSNQYIGQTSKNSFISVSMAGALQIPGIIIALVCCRRFGRRITIVVFLVICGVSNGLLALPEDWFYAKLVFGSVGVSTASGAFSVMYMYTTELFPTVIRNMALGSSSMSSRVGSMVAPFVAGLGSVGAPAVFAAAPLVAAGACYCLPETKGVNLPDVLED